MNDAFEKWLGAPDSDWKNDKLNVAHAQLEAWQACDTEWRALVEKLVGALDYLRDDFVEYWYGEQGKSADIKSIVEADKALALAEAKLRGWVYD